MLKILALTANLSHIPRVQKPGLRPTALAFLYPRLGQKLAQAKSQARLGLAFFGLAWPGFWLQAGASTSLLAAKLSIQCPEYVASEHDLEFGDLGSFVTSYHILVSVVAVFPVGSLKTTSLYGIFFTDTIWVEWLFWGLVLSLCINFNLAQVNQTLLNYDNPALGSTSLVYMKTTH